MKKKKTSVILLALLMCCMVFSVGLTEEANAAKFPNRQVQVIFPWNPGTTFAVSQVVARGMSKYLGKNVVVTSLPGASGLKAGNTVLSKPANGYTIFDGFIAPMLLAKLNGNGKIDYENFKPLYGAFASYFTLVARKDETRFSDINSMLDYIKANPAKLTYSAGGDVSIPHMATASMLQEADAIARYIPFGSSNEGVKNLLSGDVDFAVINAGVYNSFKDDLKNYGVLSDTKQPAFGDIPGVAELGVKMKLTGVGAAGWTWWVVKSDTPDDVVEILRDAMAKALNDPDVIKKIEALSYSVLSAEEYSPENYTKVYEQLKTQFEQAKSALNWEQEMIKKYHTK